MNVKEFFLPILRPYKWHYVVMFQIPMITVAFNVLNSYALKLIVDDFGSGVPLYPIAILIGIAALQEVVCRVGQWAFIKSQPFIRGEIISKAYNYVQYHSCGFFQNTHSGSISSKIKGIVGCYDDIFEYIWWKITNPFVMIFFGVISIIFINLYLALIVLTWCIIYFYVIFKMSRKLGVLSQKSNNLKHDAIGMIADNITNIFTIFSFTKRKAEFNRVKDFTCGEVADMDYKKNLYDFKMACTGAVLFCLILSTILLYTCYLKHLDMVTSGDFAYIITIVYKIIYDIWALSEKIGGFFDKIGDFKSSFAILQMPHNNLDKKDSLELII
jgi:ATP-binding cassette subfamily B protein